jgi:dolichyl-phosphate-mannose--protein O-mannosyl transferase
LKRPVSYFFEAGPDCATNPDCSYEEILATGNPFVWWSSILAMLYVTWSWIRARVSTFRRPEPLILDRDPFGPEGVILAGFTFTYLLWLLPAFNRPAEFLFYVLPAVPFMCLALGYVAARIGRSWEARAAVGIFLTATIVLFIWFLPILNKTSIPKSQWDRRIWEFRSCDKPPGEVIQSTTTYTTNGVTTTETSSTSTNDSLPPTGWCWI